MVTEVYSWRVSRDLKAGLEREARRRKLSLSKILDMAAREWLSRSGAENESDEGQLRLHRAASKWLGAFAGQDPHRSESVRETMRQRLRRRYDR
jgi:hypothetical protein